MTGKTGFKTWKARGEGNCKCVEMVDIGVYNTCKHFCKYCYANFDEKKVIENMKKHNSKSSLLIGELEKDDVIKVRK
jgi:DNA repair photolyase